MKTKEILSFIGQQMWIKWRLVESMVNGSHIPTRMPADSGIDYYNRKDFYSIVLQAVCRKDLRFTNVYCGWPGKVHDARIFRQSPLCGRKHILADSANLNLKWVLSPFRDNDHVTAAQKRFNQVGSTCQHTEYNWLSFRSAQRQIH